MKNNVIKQNSQLSKGRSMTGKIVSTKMVKTVIVEIVRTHAHWLYKKTMRKAHRFAAHNEIADVKVGDTVKIKETRPISKQKHFIVVEKIMNL